VPDYFDDVINVKGDGHCGFRAAALLLGKSVGDHIIIRLDLITELNRNWARYLKLYGGKDIFDYIMNALTPMTGGDGSAPREKWTTLPDMVFLLAQRYKHVVALLTGKVGYSKTYFPLECEPTSAERLICLVWVNGNHFMAVCLKPGSPLPPTSEMWVGHRCENVSKWPDRYIDRMSAFGDFMCVHGVHVVEDHGTPKIVPVVDLDSLYSQDSIVPINLDED
jgi:histone-lysine N-methyltransferase SETD2